MPEKPLPTWINGKRADSLPVSDRGLAYGDGVFETIAVISGKPRLLPLHLERLSGSLERMRIPFSESSCLARINQSLEESGMLTHSQNGTLKLIVTAGESTRGYSRPQNISPSTVIQLLPPPGLPVSFRQGIHTELSRYRLPLSPELAGIKHLNRLDQVLVSNELRAGVQEMLVCSHAGDVVEGTKTNLFIVKNDRVFTPLLDRCGVSGVMRRYLMEQLLPRMGIEAEEKRIRLGELLKADEVFLCNSMAGLWPVNSLGVHVYGCGPITAKLMRVLADDGFESFDV